MLLTSEIKLDHLILVCLTILIIVSVVSVCELTLRHVCGKTVCDYGSFTMSKSSVYLDFKEVEKIVGGYPDNFLTEEFWLKREKIRKILDEKRSAVKKNLGLTSTHKVDLLISIFFEDFEIRNGFRKTTDIFEQHGANEKEIKVYLLGGSTVFGMESPDRLTSSSALQRVANLNGVPLRVINCAANGVGVVNRVAMLEDLPIDEKSILCFVFGTNDSGWFDRKSGKLVHHVVSPSLKGLRFCIERGSVFASFLYSKVSTRFLRPFSDNAVNSAIEALTRANEYCVGHGAKMIAVLEPNLYTRRFAPCTETVLRTRFSRDLKTCILESYKSYEEWIRSVSFGSSASGIFDECVYPIFLDWCHLSPRGNELIAKFIFEEMKLRGILTLE